MKILFIILLSAIANFAAAQQITPHSKDEKKVLKEQKAPTKQSSKSATQQGTTNTAAVAATSQVAIIVDTIINNSCNGGNTGAVYIIPDTTSILTNCVHNQVALNEIMYRPIASNGVNPNTGEYIELIGPAGTNIGCYVLTDGDWTITIPPGTIIPPDGIFTIGNNIVWGAGTFDLDAENCACFTEGTGGNGLLILTDAGEYVALFNSAGTFIQGLIYGTPTPGNTPNGSAITTIGTGGCPASVTIPTAPSFETGPGSLAAGTSLIRNPDGSGTWASQAGGSVNNCNVGPVPVIHAPLTYIWSNGATTQNNTGLAAGVYCVTVTDATAATATTCVTITQPSAITASIASSTNVLCNGAATGAATAAGVGGTGAFTFNWNNGSTTAISTGLAAGIHPVTITDVNGCAAITTVTITQPNAVTASIASSTNVLCNGGASGSATAAGAGGTGAFTFNWNNASTTATNTGLTAGIYCVTVTDANLCTATACVTITEPTTVTASITSSTNVLCSGASTGAATAAGAGGTSPYSFIWSNAQTTAANTGLSAGIYCVTISDANSCTATTCVTITEPSALTSSTVSITDATCSVAGAVDINVSGGTAGYSFNWSNNATTEDISGLTGGSYTVTITDANSCSITNGPNVVNSVGVPSLSITNSNNISCNGGNDGFMDITTTGGTPIFSYLWNTNATTEDISGLTAGIYTVTLTDGNGCTTTISSTLTEPTLLTASTTVNNLICNGNNNGSIDLTANGGTTNYNFNWGGGIATEDRTGLIAGVYIVTITDANSCTTTTSATITEPSALTASIASSTNITCNGGNNGTATAAGTGGTGAFSYIWSIGAQTTDMITGLAVGTYMVTISDQNACTDTVSVVITEPIAITLTITTTDALCNGSATGTAGCVAAGVLPLNYAWSNGAAGSNISGLSAGQYCITVTDANSCTATICETITEPSIIDIPISNTAIFCNGGNNATATATPTGGTVAGAYSYTWSNNAANQTTATATGLTAGVYTVTVVDDNTCSAIESITITQPNPVQVSLTPIDVSCGNTNNGSITASVTGGTDAYTYQWNAATGNQTTIMAMNLTSNNYSIVVTDSLGCTATASTFVGQATPLDTADVPLVVLTGILDCDLNPIGALSINTTGSYTYNWSNGATTRTATGLTAGSYTVTVTNSLNCKIIQSATITSPLVPFVNPFISSAGLTSITVAKGIAVDINSGNNQSGLVNYVWTSASADINFGNENNYATTASSLVAGAYVLTITATAASAPNCVATGTVTLNVQSTYLGMPTAFSPNNDYINELYFPVGLSAPDIIKFRVFNRWGQEVYIGDELENGGWDGRYMGVEQPSDVYLYSVEYNLGASPTNKIMRGEFVLIR